jgi:hypothetical protein
MTYKSSDKKTQCYPCDHFNYTMHYNILGEYSHLKLMNTHETEHVQMSLVAALICFRENVPFGKSSPLTSVQVGDRT